MPDKQAIIKDIRSNWGNMLNIRQAAEVFGCDRKTVVPRYLAELPYLKLGKEKKYLATDIAGMIYRHLEVSE